MGIHYKTTTGRNFLETADAVTAATIKGAKIVYRPGAELKNMLKTLNSKRNHDLPQTRAANLLAIFA